MKLKGNILIGLFKAGICVSPSAKTDAIIFTDFFTHDNFCDVKISIIFFREYYSDITECLCLVFHKHVIVCIYFIGLKKIQILQSIYPDYFALD